MNAVNARHRFTVTFRDLSTGNEKTIRLLAEGEQDAISLAVRRLWGKSAGWWRDHGLVAVGNFGQVTAPIKGQPGVKNCLTGRQRVDVVDGYR